MSQEYRVNKILTVLGDGDKTEEVLQQITAENAERMGMIQQTQAEQGESEESESEPTEENADET